MDAAHRATATATGAAAREVSAELDRIEQELRRATGARRPDPARLAGALEAAVDATRRWPHAGEVFRRGELLGELSEVYEQLDRTDDALAVMAEAIDAGYASWPDPRCRLAEIQLRAGRPDPAHQIFAQVKADTPDDVWLYNNAGLEYGHAGDHERAVAWLAEGLELAMRTGDPERLVAQMSDLRRGWLAALGREHDELEARADAFLADPPPRPPRWTPGQVPAVLGALGRAGGSALVAPAAAVPAVPTAAASGRAPGVQMAFSWFPAAEFTAALAAWPQLAQEWGTRDHGEYCRRTQQHLLRFADAQRQRAGPASGPAWLVPIRLAPFRAWCARAGRDPATGAARAGYAADRARAPAGADEAILWPPARNDRCWCGSGRKYKQCCGHPTVTAGPS